MMTELITSAVLFIFFLLSASGWGQMVLAIFHRWQRANSSGRTIFANPSERYFLAVVAGSGILSWLGLMAGFAGLYYASVAWLLFGIGLVGFVLSLNRRDFPKMSGASSLWRWPLTWPLIIIATTSSLYTLLTNTLIPPHEWDEVAYHLALPKLYLAANRLIYVPFIVHSNWPMNTEMLFTWALLLGSELLAHFITWGMSLITAWGLYLVGQRFFHPRVGVVAATLYLTIPLVIRLSGTGLIDVSLAFYGSAVLLGYGYYLRQQSLPWLGLVGLFAGLSAGSKLMGGAYPLFIGLFLVVMWLIERPLRWRVLITRLLVFGGIGLLMVGPWYGRSYATTGNPVWPFAYSIFGGGPDWDDLGDEYHTQQMMEIWATDIPTSVTGFFISFYYLYNHPVQLGGYHGGVGHALLLLTITGLGWALLKKRSTPVIIYHLIWFIGAYYLVWFFVVSRQVRFLFTIFPLLCLLSAFGFISFWHYWRSLLPKLLLSGLLLITLLKELPWLNPQALIHLESRLPVAAGQVTREDFLAARVRAWPAFTYANENLPDSALILLLPYENRGYYLDRDYIWGHPASQRIIKFEKYTNEEQLAADLRKMGITHIIENPEWLYADLRYWDKDRELMLALQKNCASVTQQWDEVLLLELSAICHQPR